MQPLVCVVDDAQWLDQASAQVLGFVARRLLAERVAIVCAARTGIGDEVLAGLPELSVGGLGDSDALALLLENLQGPVDAAVSRRIVAESHGNPLALVEFPRTWRVAELAGGFGLPEDLPVTGKIEHSYRRRLHRLPSDTQLLVLAAAAEPVGDPVLLQRAAELLEIDMAAAEAAADAGLLTIRGGRSSLTHSFALAPTARRRPTTAIVCIVHSPTPPMPKPIPTDGHGTAHARLLDLTKRSPRSSNVRPAAPRPAAASPPRPRSCSAQPSCHGTRRGVQRGRLPRPRRTSKQERSMPCRVCWLRQRAVPSTASSGRGLHCCVGMSPWCRATAMTLRRCSCAQRESSKRSTSISLARPT